MLRTSGAPALTLRPAIPSARSAHDLAPADPRPRSSPAPHPRPPSASRPESRHPTTRAPRLDGSLGAGCVSASGYRLAPQTVIHVRAASATCHATDAHQPTHAHRLIHASRIMPRLPPRLRRHLGLFADLPRPVDGVHDHRAMASYSS
jgi:hypothetical protein